MLRWSGLPPARGRRPGRRLSNTLTARVSSTRSQPDMTLVGVRSVLSPRPFSAPQEALARTTALRDSDHVYGGSLQPSEQSYNEMDDFSDQSDVTNLSASQSNASYDSFSHSRDSENNITNHSHDENENSVDTAIDVGDDYLPESVPEDEEGSPSSYRLITQASRDSAFGSSTDGMTREVPDDNSIQALPPDAHPEHLQQPDNCESHSDNGEETDERISPNSERSNHDQSSGQDSEDDDVKTPTRTSCQPEAEDSEDELPSRTAPDLPRGSPELKSTVLTPATNNSRIPKDSATTIIPPAIVTSDLTKGDPVPGALRAEVNLQEVIDLRLVESQRSGHLDLSNLGLPFFPSAVLLADCSIIHRVSLQDNGLQDLPGSSLTQLTCVTWLDLRYNLLQDLPWQVACLTRLQVLLLQGNRLTALPTCLGTLSELATLQVSGNPITFPPPDVIKGGTRAILRFLKEKCDAEENSDGLPTSSPAAGEVEPLGNHPGSTPDAKRRSESLRESSFDDQDGEESESAVWCGWYSEGEGRQARVAENAPESHYEGDESDDGDETSRNSSVHSTSFRIAIKAGGDSVVEQDLHLGLQEEPDSERDTLGRPPSSTSACLLTPNFEFPTRPEYDLTREDSSSDRGLAEGPCRPEDDPSIATWSCTCFQDPSPITRDKMHIFGRSPDSTSKHRFLKTLPDTLESLLLPVGSIMVPSMAPGHIGGHRRTLHLHLQGDNHHLEDDMESLEGDLGEGYRRPHSEPFCDIEKECHRKVSCVSLPVVSLQLPALEGHLLQERGPRPGLASNRRIARRPRPGAGSRRTQKEHHKPKLVTVAEVHRRAREARRRQREMLAATREMNASQRLKSVAGLEDWREEAKQLQLQQQYHHTLHPNAYLPAVCEAPFAIDGTMLTPRARSKIKTKEDQKRSLSPSVSQVTGVCAGVRSCLEELSTAAGGAAGGEEGGSLAHTASIVTQLHHLRRQLNRLKVNCVI